MSTQASRGAEALERKDFSSAIQHYTSALSEFPTSPDFYIKRSTAYQRSSPPDYDHALQDAERAVYHAHRRGKRELIATAQMRRGIALFGLKRWADAMQCFEWAKKKNEKEQGLNIWQKKAEVELQKVQGETGNGEEGVTVVEISEPARDSSLQEKSTTKKDAAGDVAKQNTKDLPAVQEIKKPEGVQTPADKIRHEWYQTSDTVVVTLFVKGVPKEKATIDIHDRSVRIRSVSHCYSSTQLIIIQDRYFLPHAYFLNLRLLSRSALRPHRPNTIQIDHHVYQDRIDSEKIHLWAKMASPGK